MWKKVLLIILGILLVLGLGSVAGLFIYSVSGTAMPTAEALAALESNDKVTVEVDDWIVFTPTAATPTAGYIFYPGGLVDARAYAPYAQAIAEQGYLVVITPMPLNLAVFSPNAADGVITDEAFADIEQWAIGGHSLGGSMAAVFVDGAPGTIEGLALWASYPADGNDLSDDATLTAVSIYGTRDGLIEVSVIDDSRPLLPSDTNFVQIDGGNHAQFGWYGPQDGDLPAEIPHEEQQAITVEATVDMLNSLSTE
jgi:hypothetical protein